MIKFKLFNESNSSIIKLRFKLSIHHVSLYFHAVVLQYVNPRLNRTHFSLIFGSVSKLNARSLLKQIKQTMNARANRLTKNLGSTKNVSTIKTYEYLIVTQSTHILKKFNQENSL